VKDCRSIVTLALRKLGRVGAGRSPRDADAADALDVLSSLYQGWIASGAFGRLRTVIPQGTLYVAPGNVRVIVPDADFTVSLPEVVSSDRTCDYGRYAYGGGTATNVEISYSLDGGTVIVDVTPGQLVSNATTPRDGWVVTVTNRANSLTRTWIYDGMTSAWQSIDGLTLDSIAPRSTNHDGLAAALAVAVSDQYGLDATAVTQRAATQYQQQMTQRFSMRPECAASQYF
jgi:hypothetical protein